LFKIASVRILNIYETERLVSEYLLFHYGDAEEILPQHDGVDSPSEVLDFAVRCVTKTFTNLTSSGRALDLGCAVGRSSFELARHCGEVVGIDFSHAFVDAAEILRTEGSMDYDRYDEGELTTRLTALRPAGIDPSRVVFQQGDAMDLPTHIGQFDFVLLANLIDRLSRPMACLDRLPDLIVPGGELVITSPYTWLENFTPKEFWLGGFCIDGTPVRTLDRLKQALAPAFEFQRTTNLPFLIREHSRKHQWSIAEASVWRRR